MAGKLGRKKTLLIGITGAMIAAAAAPFSPNKTVFLALRLMIGLGNGLAYSNLGNDLPHGSRNYTSTSLQPFFRRVHI